MSTNRSRRIGRRTAEQLLGGAPGRAPAAGSEPLSDLLAAAAAPAREGELAGEQAALAAFRTARLADDPQARRELMQKTTLAKVLTVKIAVVAATVVAAGGVALAAATGTLPMPGKSSSTVAPPTTAAFGSSEHESGGKPTDRDKKNETETTKNTPGGNGNGKDEDKDKANPSPSIVGLCNAYLAGEKAEHGKALENPAFSALITAAGGKDKVPAFCEDVLAAKKDGQPSHPNENPPTDRGNGNPPTDKGNGNPPTDKGNGPPVSTPEHPGR